jgi:hypothetical protein
MEWDNGCTFHPTAGQIDEGITSIHWALVSGWDPLKVSEGVTGGDSEGYASDIEVLATGDYDDILVVVETHRLHALQTALEGVFHGREV